MDNKPFLCFLLLRFPSKVQPLNDGPVVAETPVDDIHFGKEL
jgi:hypothetical protein